MERIAEAMRGIGLFADRDNLRGQ